MTSLRIGRRPRPRICAPSRDLPLCRPCSRRHCPRRPRFSRPYFRRSRFRLRAPRLPRFRLRAPTAQARGRNSRRVRSGGRVPFSQLCPAALYVRVDTTRSLQQCKGRGAHQSDKSNNLSQELGDTLRQKTSQIDGRCLRQRAGQHFPTGNGSCLNRGTNQLGGVTHQGEQPGCLGEKLGDA